MSENYWKHKFYELKSINDHAEQIYTNIGYSNAVKEYSEWINKLKHRIYVLEEELENLRNENSTEDSNISYVFYGIDMYEYERGWGSRPDGTVYFHTLNEALDYFNYFCKEYLSGDHTPDCYTKPSKPKIKHVNKEERDEILKKMITKNGMTYYWK